LLLLRESISRFDLMMIIILLLVGLAQVSPIHDMKLRLPLSTHGPVFVMIRTEDRENRTADRAERKERTDYGQQRPCGCPCVVFRILTFGVHRVQ
jgi:hypothetical protein